MKDRNRDFYLGKLRAQVNVTQGSDRLCNGIRPSLEVDIFEPFFYIFRNIAFFGGKRGSKSCDEVLAAGERRIDDSVGVGFCQAVRKSVTLYPRRSGGSEQSQFAD